MAGFEPANAGVKVPCLTIWLHPIVFAPLFMVELATHHFRYIRPFLPDSVPLAKQFTFQNLFAVLALVINLFTLYSHHTSSSGHLFFTSDKKPKCLFSFHGYIGLNM